MKSTPAVLRYFIVAEAVAHKISLRNRRFAGTVMNTAEAIRKRGRSDFHGFLEEYRRATARDAGVEARDRRPLHPFSPVSPLAAQSPGLAAPGRGWTAGPLFSVLFFAPEAVD
jgi:hypothetical protein